MARDKLYTETDADPGSFEFNEAVADVFPDMLRRSIPGYDATIRAIGALSSRHVTDNTNCFDLGCSLGAATIAMQENITAAGCQIVAIDLSPAMVSRCRAALAGRSAATPVEVIEADVRDVEITNASMVVMNYTLQFVPREDRDRLIRKIHQGMVDGGIFVLSEKVGDEDPAVEALLTDLHLDFKRRNAYSELEIARKRTALENVLIPESTRIHLERMATAGFRHCAVWLRRFNFVSMIAIR